MARAIAMSIFEELKRRNVFRVAIGYVITAWLLLQIVDLVLENVNAPDWVMQVFMLALAIGFPLAVFFAWAFEMTPEGVKREADVDRTSSIAPQTGRKMDRNIIIAMALGLAYFAYDKFSSPEPVEQPQSVTSTNVVEENPVETVIPQSLQSKEKSVAVLPFINMSDDKENEYFSDGISEELLNVLVKVEGLRVPSRTSSFTFKGSDKKVTEIGRELKVDNVLEGSVRKSGSRIRVTAQLIDVNTDTHLWSETYTRELDDIFAVQDEIAQAIVSALKITLSGGQEESLSTRSTTSVEAYNKFLLGRHLWNKRSRESMLAAVKPLKDAVAMDPAFEKAWAALADTYVLIPEYQGGSTKQFVPLARAATDKALAINPLSAHALTTSAYIKFMSEYDFKGAHAGFLKAIEIDPTYATAHQWYGELLAVERKPDAALAELKLARQLDPLAPVIPHVMGWVLAQTDRKDEAYQYYQEALDIDPHFVVTVRNLVDLNIKTGQFEQARERTIELSSLSKEDTTIYLASIDAVENPEMAEVLLEQLKQLPISRSGVVGNSFFLMLLNKHELALDDLEKSFTEGDAYAVHMNRLDVYDPLRDHPRFQALLAKMNLWPSNGDSE
jgi:TolB-like protein/tetratricopeptide (TPR) repeat protein